jgi:hypothetical protein
VTVVVVGHVVGEVGGVVEQGESERFEAEAGAPDREVVALGVGDFGEVYHELYVFHQKRKLLSYIDKSKLNI